MNSKSCCGRKTEYDLVFACSGASDVGAISDQASRQLNGRGIARSSCAIGVAAGIEKILDSASAARRIVVIDGCEGDCARICIERADLPVSRHFRLTDMGMEKGQSPANEARVGAVTEAVENALPDSNNNPNGE